MELLLPANTEWQYLSLSFDQYGKRTQLPVPQRQSPQKVPAKQ